MNREDRGSVGSWRQWTDTLSGYPPRCRVLEGNVNDAQFQWTGGTSDMVTGECRSLGHRNQDGYLNRLDCRFVVSARALALLAGGCPGG